ncbi:MAG TPA: isoprenylcysteine carboxylmethyltransferase family protein [Anaerolineales bacterium]|nr:isoprenylcysteine carboxylmethyltransferase family protein [Anaerolineales bacterium]HLO29705.1 isoprenylcysteine carboxylmethyltransferase family protein [Anaerolineales bacterium]
MAVKTYYILVYVALLLVGRFISQRQRKSEGLLLQTQKIAKDPTAMVMALSVFLGFSLPLFEAALRVIFTPTWVTVIGIVFIASGFFLARWANRSIAENWSPVINKTTDQRLAQSGAYSVVRHPLYLSGLLLLIGTNLYFGNSWSWLSTILALIITLYRIPIEEKQLVSRFGQEYADYKRQTKALIPWIW